MQLLSKWPLMRLLCHTFQARRNVTHNASSVLQRRGGTSSSLLAPCGVPLAGEDGAAARDVDVDAPSVPRVASAPTVLHITADTTTMHPIVMSRVIHPLPIPTPAVTIAPTRTSVLGPARVGGATVVIPGIGVAANIVSRLIVAPAAAPNLITITLILIEATATTAIIDTAAMLSTTRHSGAGAASSGGGPLVAVVEDGVVHTSPTSGGDSGGGDESATAPTTCVIGTVTTSVITTIPIPSPIALIVSIPYGLLLLTQVLIIDSGHIRTDGDHGDADNSSLLHPTAGDVDNSSSGRRRSRTSGVTLRFARISDCSPPPPAVVEVGAA